MIKPQEYRDAFQEMLARAKFDYLGRDVIIENMSPFNGRRGRINGIVLDTECGLLFQVEPYRIAGKGSEFIENLYYHSIDCFRIIS